jgi:Mg-chelatase subunit ChlD
MSSGDVGRCVIVLISDGRANVPLSISTGEAPDEAEAAAAAAAAVGADGKPVEKKKLTDAEKKEQRTFLKDEVLGIARQIGSMPTFKLLVIDTENKFVSTGVAKEIAEAAGVSAAASPVILLSAPLWPLLTPFFLSLLSPLLSSPPHRVVTTTSPRHRPTP